MISSTRFVDSINGLDKDTKMFLALALKAASKAGEYLLSKHKIRKTDLKIDVKAHNDYVTEADKTSESIIIETIRTKFLDHAFLAEESAGSKASETEPSTAPRWIIDPLDGTTNFINGFPVWAVSIALETEGGLHIGVVHDPLHNETFYAVRNRGAYLNGSAIKISAKTDFSRALLLTGFPFKAQQHLDIYLESFKRLFRECSGIRRAGCASLDLSWLAAGRADGFWELSLSPWDMAAGTLLIREAGGTVTDIHGDQERFMQTGNITAGNSQIHDHILAITKDILSALP
jgi:myo-inositol-1(or 4)-monophosphatase